jgi:DNA-binding MarR family transcriptional regulator
MCCNSCWESSIFSPVDDQAIAERIRSFNRLYTQAIGSLDDRHEGLDVSLAQSRMLYTIGSLGESHVNELADSLGLDLAYTSRVLGTLEDGKLIRRTISKTDRRQRVVTLTAKGRRLLEEIYRRSNQRVLALVAHLDDDELQHLLDAMDTIGVLIATKDHQSKDER